MHNTTLDVLRKTALLRRGCEVLIEQLEEVDQLVEGIEALTPTQEAAVTKASEKTIGATERLEFAIRYVALWKQELKAALNVEPSWLE